MTQLLLDELGCARPPWLDIRYVNTSVSRRLEERERFQWHKLAAMARQVRASIGLARRGYDAYYPISQSLTGLIHDVALLIPYRIERRKIIIHLHGSRLPVALLQQPWWLRRAVRVVLATPRTSGIVLTPSLRTCLEGLVPLERVAVVSNAVRVPAMDVEQMAKGVDCLRVVFLSSLFPNKGYRELIRAVISLASRGVSITLAIAGEPLTAYDQNWIQRNASHPSIRILGHLEGKAKWDLLSQAHCLALPVVAPEGQPLAILEGMAAGCAILTTDWGGIRETVGPEAGTILGQLRGPALQAQLEAVLASWAAHIADVVAMGRTGRDRCRRTFSPDQFVAAWLHAIAGAFP